MFQFFQETHGHNQCLVAFSVELDMSVNMLFPQKIYPCKGQATFKRQRVNSFKECSTYFSPIMRLWIHLVFEKTDLFANKRRGRVPEIFYQRARTILPVMVAASVVT